MAVVRVTTREPIGVELSGFGRGRRLESIVRNHRFRQLHIEVLPAGRFFFGRCPAVNMDGAQCEKSAGHGKFHAIHSGGRTGWNETWL